MNSNQDEDRMIAKIRKLFALAANDGATGNESENALRMANALLLKHSITKYQLHDKDEVFANFLDYPTTDWVQKVCMHICKLYNCRVIFDMTWKPAKTLIIGTSSNRITTILVIDQLIDQIKKNGGKIDFKNGAAYGLGEVCKKIIAERTNEEVIPGTGIMVLDIVERSKLDVDAFIQSNFKGLVKTKSKGRMSEAGRQYGKGLNPGARMNGASQKCLN